MKIYDVNEYMETFGCAKTTAEIEITQIRKETKELGYTVMAGRRVSDTMLMLTGRLDRVDPLVIAEIKKANALEEIALALKEKTSTGMDALEKITTSL